jgi:lysophospholipase L1-like esterase
MARSLSLSRVRLQGRGGIGGGAAAPFNPLDEPDLVHLSIWHTDASDNGTTLTIDDRSTNGTNFTATTANRPVLNATNFAGQQGVSAAALAAGGAFSSAALGPLLVGEQQCTIFMLVGHDPNSQTSGYLFRYGSPAAGDFIARTKLTGQGQLSGTQYNAGGTSDFRAVSQAEKLLHPKVVCWQFDGSLAGSQVPVLEVASKQLNGTYPTNTVNTTTFLNRTMYLLANFESTSFKGTCGGLVVIRRALTSDERAQWTTWLAAQYNLGPSRQHMFCGDSITAAGGYKARMLTLFGTDQAAGTYPWNHFELFGPLGNTTDYPHGATSGWTIADLRTGLATWLAAGTAYYPEYMPVMIGINDIILSGSTGATVAAGWTSLLGDIYAARPDTKIKLLSLIRNTTNATNEQRVIDANALGPTVVSDFLTANPGADVEWVTQAYDVDLTDGTHPSAAGYDEMGDVLYPLMLAW